MTPEEILEAIANDKTMPFIQPDQLANIVDFAIKNYKPSLPSNLDEAAEEYAEKHQSHDIYDCYGNPESDTIGKNLAFRSGAEWMAGQFVLVGGEPTGWFRENNGSEYATGLDLKEPIKLPVDFYVRKK